MIKIEHWPESHPQYSELTELAESIGQRAWLEARYEWHVNSYTLVAIRDGNIDGFLRFIVQAIGVEEDQPPFTFDGRILYEAKVLAFAVLPAQRRQGIGRALQEQLVDDSRRMGLYQIRSHRGIENIENHLLKASLKFGIHPLPSTGQKKGFYFILPL